MAHARTAESTLARRANAADVQKFISLDTRVPELDGIRGMAIALVLVAHYLGNTIAAPSSSLVAMFRSTLFLGWSGVDLFFVLSGFLIGGILWDVRHSDRYFQTFYLRRMHRIFPIYYILVGLFTVAVLAKVEEWGPGLKWALENPLPLWSYVTFTQNIATAILGDYGPHTTNITWSLAVEEQFYLVLPLAVRYLSRKRLLQLVVVSIALAPVLRMFFFMQGPNGYKAAYVLMPCRADALGMGVLAALLLRDPHAWSLVVKWRRYVIAAMCLLGTGMIMITVRKYGHESRFLNAVGYSWISAFYLSVLLVTIIDRGRTMGRVFRNPALQWLGIASYFIYLFHNAFLGVLHQAVLGRQPLVDGPVSVLVTVAAAAITFAAAGLSWKYFEAPLVKHGRQYKY